MSDTPILNRIMIVGGSGTGKLTLAHALSNRLQLPIIHMDHLFWEPGWVQRNREEVIRLAQEAADETRWVFEGNNSGSWDYRAKRADLIVILELSRWLRMWRLLKRTLRSYGRSRPDMADGCPERFDWGFWKWSWTYDGHSGHKLKTLAMKWSGGCRVVWLTTPSEVRRFLNAI